MVMECDILSAQNRTVIGRCVGPAEDGSCPRVKIGDVIPCAGCVLRSAHSRIPTEYLVSTHATLCPVTLGAALVEPELSPLFDRL